MRTTFSSLTVIVALTLMVAVPGCGGDSAGAAKCDELGDLCDDAMTDLGKECHDVGHDADPKECTARYDECVKECKATP